MKKFTTAIILVICSVALLAGDVSRKGTTGAEQLLIPVGARGIATGGAFLSNVTGLEAIYYNPAGLDLGVGSEAMFSYMTYLADINVSYFAVGAKLGSLGSFALSFKTLDFGNIDVTTVENPDGTGSTYSPSYMTGALTYSKIVTDRVTVGVTAKVVSEKIMSSSANGYALDFGVQYRFDNNLSIGAAVKNIGSNMIYSGNDLQVKTDVPGSQIGAKSGVYEAVTEEYQMPSYFEISTAYSYNINDQNNLIIGSNFRNNNAAEDQLSFGLEYGFINTFFIRGGYNMLLENTQQQIYGATFGAGIQYSIAENMNIKFDYAFRSVKDFPDPNHVITVKLSLE
jgi:opacity protein-like surface antigen